jgi:hypothetical protein
MQRRDFLTFGAASLAGSTAGATGSTPPEVEEGRIVGVSATGRREVTDPRDFPNDSRAIQAVIDVLLEPPSRGTVYLPAARPDGTPLTLPETVHCGHRAPGGEHRTGVSVVHQHPHARLQTTIDDGSPVFTAYRSWHTHIHLNVESEGGPKNFVGLLTGDRTVFNDIRLRVVKYRGTALVVDAGSFGQDISVVSRALNQYQDEQAAAVAVRFQNTIEVEKPPGNSSLRIRSDSLHRKIVEFTAESCAHVSIGGHLEGAGGEANVDCGTNNDVTLLDGTDVTGYHFEGNRFRYGVRCAGDRATLYVGAVRFGPPREDGAVIRCDGGDRYCAEEVRVSPSVNWPTGTAAPLISMVDRPVAGAAWSTVPHPALVDGKVEYPSNQRRLRHYDGSERVREGEQRLVAGEEVTVPVERMGEQRRSYRVETYVDPTSLSAPVRVEDEILFAPEGEMVQLVLRETSGRSAVRVEWHVYRSRLPA